MDNWWMNRSCIKNGKVLATNLEKLIETSLVLAHYPRIEDKDADKPNVGNIVSKLCL